jgi:hypothetical protein
MYVCNSQAVNTIIIFSIFLFIACTKIKSSPVVHDKRSTEVSFDLSVQGKTVKNIFSDVNVWDFRIHWTSNAINQPANYFSTNYPFVKTVQFMTATGGNAARDLFINPNDDKTLNDYKFDDILLALHNVVNQGLKPMIKTGAVPLKYSVNPTIGGFGVNVRPPYNFDLYYEYIKAFAGVLVTEFGINEVKTWSWGVLTEYENKDWFLASETNPDSTKIAYFKLYDYSVAALQDAIGADNLIVGAHSMTCNPGLWDEGDFIDHVATGINYKTGKKGTQINFLAASYYDKQPGIPVPENLTLINTINTLRNKAVANGLSNLKYGIDEGRILSGPIEDGRDLNSRIVAHSFQGASDARLFKTMNDIDVDWFTTWGLSTEGFWGGVPSVGTHIANFSYKMVGESQLKLTISGGAYDLNNEVSGMGSYNSSLNKAHIMIFNYNKNMNSNSNESPIISIKNILPVTGSSVVVKKWTIDDEHGNFWPFWIADMNSRGLANGAFDWSSYSLGIPQNMISQANKEFWYSKEAFYKTRSALNVVTNTLTITNNNLILFPKLSHHGVIFYEIENVKPIQ